MLTEFPLLTEVGIQFLLPLKSVPPYTVSSATSSFTSLTIIIIIIIIIINEND